MRKCRQYVTVISLLAAMSIAAVAFPWQTLHLSLQNLSVMRASAPYHTSGEWPRLSQDSKQLLCPSSEESLVAPPVQTQGGSRYRLARYLFLSCASTEALAKWISEALASGLTPDEADIIYFSQALVDNGESEQALTLRRMDPEAAIWYVHRGRLSIESEGDEAGAKRYFQIAQHINPRLDARKAHMYMYLCMEAIRNGRGSVISDPCADFESVEQSVTSESMLGQMLVLQGRHEEAINHLLRAIELDGTQPDSYYWAAIALLKLGDNTRARQVLQDGSRLTTSNLPIMLELARLDIAEGCYTSAEKRLSVLPATGDPHTADEVASMLDIIAGREDTSTDCE
jgi:tetratricopeptide (TPR) repeat protein